MPATQESRTSKNLSFGFTTGSDILGHGQNTIGTQGPLHFVFGMAKLLEFTEPRSISPDEVSFLIVESRTSGSLGFSTGSGLFGLLLFGLGNFGNQNQVGSGSPQASQEIRTNGTA